VGVTGEVNVRNWWRWILRALAVIALVIGGVLLFIQLIANENVHVPGSTEVLTFGCSTPFQQFQGNPLWITGSPTPPGPVASSDTYLLKCDRAGTEREHIIEALGTGAVILIVLSFWRQRRPVMTVPVNPAML
jgi:hypothetical protein